MLLYTFMIHDPEPDSLTFECIAPSIEIATLKCRSVGYKEFTLTDTRELLPSETEEFALAGATSNPFVGPHWAPVIEAFSILIASRETDKREPTWSVDVLAYLGNDAYERRCFVQGLVEMDGSMHLELSNDLARGGDFSDEQIAQLEFVGWARFDDYNIFFVEFPPGWSTRYVATRVIEALTTIHGIDENAQFLFTVNDELNARIERETGLVNVTVNSAKGFSERFAMPNSAAISWAQARRVERDARPET